MKPPVAETDKSVTESVVPQAHSPTSRQETLMNFTPAPLIPLPRPAWLSQSVWPFETSALEVNEARIAVTDVGQGPALLFVHTGLWSFIWRDVISRLAADFRCVCFDAPGTGRSDRLPVGDISLERAAQALTAVIAALNLQDVTLVFHDLGGPSGIAGAAHVPNRVRGLCAINAFAWKPSGIPFRGMLALMGTAAMTEIDVVTQLIPRISASALGVGLHLDRASRNAFFEGIGPGGIRAFHGYLRDARKSRAIYEQVESALIGPFRHLPLLTIFGERNDPLGFQPRWKQLFPSVHHVVVRKGNHFPMCDAPNLVAASIREFHRDHVAPALA